MNRLLAAALATTFAGTAAIAQAADNPWDKTFTLQLGAFRADASTTIKLDADITSRPGTSVSLEKDFGVVDTKTLPQFDFTWRWNKHHGLEGSWVSLDRSGSRTIDRTIDWGDVSFPISATVNSQFESDTLRVAYRYSPINDQGTELAFLLGLHYTDMKVTASVQNNQVISDEASVDFPLPTIGIRGSAVFADNWRVTGFAQLLKLKIDEYDGELTQFGVGVEWAFHPSAYVGVGYNYYKYNLVSEKANARGEFDYRFDGPSIYLGYSF